MENIRPILFFGLLYVLGSCSQNKTETVQNERPNIIVILADDMGYSDLGVTGSEIETPNLDKMANEGLLFTHAYNTSRCCPSRASLLTGLYQHRAGVGFMSADMGIPAYQGFLNKECVTMAEVLKESGYRTIMTGKWHVGDEREQWPDKRGFDRFFGIPKGGGLYFYPSKFIDRPIYRNDTQVKPDSTTFYSTNAFTDEAIQFMDEERSPDQPFFLYLAYIAPHFPLQALPEDIEKYKGKYDEGYKAIRQKRFDKQKALHLLPDNIKLSPPVFPSWELVENKAEEARKMEVYAAQVDRLDQNIGKLLQHLKEKGELENTIIFFLSDNGACAEVVDRSPGAETGTAQSFKAYGENWANVSNTPNRLYKSMEHEGGITTPLIIHWPKGIKNHGKRIDVPVHINDMMPTVLELATANYPEQYKGNKIQPLDGHSFVKLLNNPVSKTDHEMYWEHMGNKAVRIGDWKLVKRFNKPWELYDLKGDPTELNNLAQSKTGLSDSLENKWNTWAQNVGVREWPIK